MIDDEASYTIVGILLYKSTMRAKVIEFTNSKCE